MYVRTSVRVVGECVVGECVRGRITGRVEARRGESIGCVQRWHGATPRSALAIHVGRRAPGLRQSLCANWNARTARSTSTLHILDVSCSIRTLYQLAAFDSPTLHRARVSVCVFVCTYTVIVHPCLVPASIQDGRHHKAAREHSEYRARTTPQCKMGRFLSMRAELRWCACVRQDASTPVCA